MTTPVWKPEHCAAIAKRLRKAIEISRRDVFVGRVFLYDGFDQDEAASLLALLEQAAGVQP